MKKILFVSRSFETFYGAEKSLTQIIQLVNNSYEVTLLTPDTPVFVETLQKSGIKGDTFDFLINKRKPVKTIIKQLHLTTKLLRAKYDFIYLNKIDSMLSLSLFIIINFFFGKAKIAMQHRDTIELSAYECFLLHLIHTIITNSESMKRTLIPKKFHNKTVSIPPFVSIPTNNTASNHTHDENVLTIIVVGMVSERKGQRLLAEAVAQGYKAGSFKQKIHVKCYGNAVTDEDKEYEVHLKEYIDQQNISDIFQLCGYTDNIDAEISKHDIAAFLISPQESAGRVLVECAFHGVPYIVSDLEQIREYTIDGKGGVWIDRFSQEAVINAINYFTDPNNLRAKISECKEVVAIRCNKEYYTHKYRNIFS